MVVLDTNIIIDHLRQRQSEGATMLRRARSVYGLDGLAVSVLTVQELYRGASTRDEAEEQQLLAILKPLELLPYTYRVAEHAGKIARDLSNPIEFADAAIAATAILNEGRLATLNEKHFTDISGLELVDI